MKKYHRILFLSVTFIIMSFISLFAQDTTKTNRPDNAAEDQPIKHQQHFIDEDGDGYNDNAPDHDGDGIPNGLDPDWLKFREEVRRQQRFVDLDGDGINDNLHFEDDDVIEGEGQNMHEQKNGSSLEKKSKEQQQKQQKKQRGKP
jgi:hypothetical protein